MRFIKETVGIILIIVFVIIIEIITSRVTNNSLEILNREIGVIEEQEKEQENEQEKGLKESIYKFSKIWDSEEKRLSCFMEHNELEEISKNVNALVFDIENNKKENIKEKISDIKFKMDHIKNKQRIKIENIF